MRAFVPAILVLALTAPGLPFAGAASLTVDAVDFRWTPAALVIDVGDTVTFRNASGIPHTWVRDDGSDGCALPCARTFAQPGTVDYHCGVHPSMRATLQVGPGITLTITSHAPGSVLSGIVRVEGRATHPSDAISSVVGALDLAPPAVAQLTGPADDVTWVLDVDTTGAIEGGHDLTVTARTDSGFRTTLTIPIVIDNPDIIDIRMLAVGAAAGATTVNTVTYSLRNEGNVATGPFRVRAEYLYQGEWHLIGERNQPSVLAGKNGVGSITWDPPGVLVGRFDLRVTGDPNDTLGDIDRTNNEARGTGGWFTSAVEGIDPLDPL